MHHTLIDSLTYCFDVYFLVFFEYPFLFLNIKKNLTENIGRLFCLLLTIVTNQEGRKNSETLLPLSQ